MGNRIKSILIGRPLKNEALESERMGVIWGLPILASDAISSVAYAGQQILIVLLPAVGMLAYQQLGYITAATIGLMALLVLSYRQTIDKYPNGGGAYVVAKDNLGVIPGVVAGAALTVGYILTVAVSVASGVEQIASAFGELKPLTVPISVLLVFLLMIGNLRGIRESARIFGVPTYAFIFGMLAMLLFGAIRIISGNTGTLPEIKPTAAGFATPLLILTLQAFSNGCSALTGVEAVSNAVPSFKDPPTRYAKIVLVLLSAVAAVMLSGTAFLAFGFHAVAGGQDSSALIVQLAEKVFGKGFMYYYITGTTFLILILAANTAYTGFPLLVSVMAREGYAPRQMSMRGDRLSFSNGIMLLSAAAALLLIVFRAKVEGLIGLYAVGVFISFTLSQTGMLARWIRQKDRHWAGKALINGAGALVTSAVVVIIAIFKFTEGAWIVVILIPVLIFLMLRVKRHYTALAKQLRVPDETFATLDISKDHYRTRVIVPMDCINQASVRALRFAKTISDNVTAFSVATDEKAEVKLRERWGKLRTDIPYIVRLSPEKKVVESILDVIKSAEYDYRKGDMITVVLPKLSLRNGWDDYIQNSTRSRIERQLLTHKHIVVATIPLHIEYDNIHDIHLAIPEQDLPELDISKNHYRNRVIVPMASITQSSVRALRFAKTISDNVTAFSVATDEEVETKLRTRWNKLHTDIPYIIKYSPYRKVVEPLLGFIKSAEYDYRKGDMITVMLPQFSVRRTWHMLLHNGTRRYIENQLLRHKHIVAAVMPFQLKDDKTALGEDEYMD
jgi:amino acid transporter